VTTSSAPDRPATHDGGRAREQAEALFAAARRVAGAEGRDRRELVRDLAEVSAGFTRDRGQRDSGYMNEARRRRAYLAWFTPVNALRIAALLKRLRAEGLLDHDHFTRVGDLGAGPLSASIGAALVAPGRIDITAVDRSKKALEEGAGLLAALADDEQVDVGLVRREAVDLRRAPTPLAPGAFSLVIIANVLNELADARRGSGLRETIVRGALRALAPGGRLLIIEPAGRVPTRALMALRDELALDAGLTLLSPCPRVRRCPLLARRSDWCHQEVHWPLPSSARALAKEAGLAAERLQLSHLLIAAADGQRGAVADTRLVGGVMGHGPQQRRYACTVDGLVALRAEGEGLVDEVRRPLRGERLARLPKQVVVEAPERARPAGRRPARQGQGDAQPRRKDERKGGDRKGGGKQRRGPRQPGRRR
jgi:SAM-dependent methyltransferase